MPMQTRLLRFLQDWEIMRVGSTTPKQIDVRIVAATNKNLERAIARGEFRSDLYYRLKVAVIAIPPLRDRQADILPLARMFLRFYGSKYHRQLTFSEEAESLLLDYKWPGNIRELENLVQGAGRDQQGQRDPGLGCPHFGRGEACRIGAQGRPRF